VCIPNFDYILFEIFKNWFPLGLNDVLHRIYTTVVETDNDPDIILFDPIKFLFLSYPDLDSETKTLTLTRNWIRVSIQSFTVNPKILDLMKSCKDMAAPNRSRDKKFEYGLALDWYGTVHIGIASGLSSLSET